MASAKKEAKNYLGSVNDYINLSGLNNERQLANDVYNTNTTSFQNAYNDLLNTISSNRTKAKTDFTKGRGTVSENAYLQNRNDIADLASRGLNGGIAQLNKLGNRMETGRQFSNLANTYYNTMNEIDATERTGTNEYNTQMETARNTLNAALADVDAREKAGRNQYKAAVAQLAEQIQARRAAQAQAAAARQSAIAQANAYKQQALQQLQEKVGAMSWADAADYLVNSGQVKTTKDAIDWLNTYTTLKPTVGGYSSPSGYGVLSSNNKKSSSSTSTAAKSVKTRYSRAHSGRATKKK